MFRRSYHSHDDSPGNLGAESPRSRAAYREAYVGAHPHFAIRGGWRNNFYTLRNGTTTDTTVIREHFFDAQYNGR